MMIISFEIIDNTIRNVEKHIGMKEAFESVGETFDQWDKINWQKDRNCWIWAPDYEDERDEYNNSKWVVDFDKMKRDGDFPTLWRKRTEYIQSAVDEIQRVKNLKILLR